MVWIPFLRREARDFWLIATRISPESVFRKKINKGKNVVVLFFFKFSPDLWISIWMSKKIYFRFFFFLKCPKKNQKKKKNHFRLLGSADDSSEMIYANFWKDLKLFFFWRKKRQGVSLAVFFQKKKKVSNVSENWHRSSLMDSKHILFYCYPTNLLRKYFF